jgi:L-alanine-DL-glutamate epimerase-like enolase superfamily enzyme
MSHFKIEYLPYELVFKHQFTVSIHSRATTPVVFVRLWYDGVYGLGEASMPPYLGETQESVINFIKKVRLSDFDDSTNLNEILCYIDTLEVGNNAAKAALDLAFHDLYAKLQGKNLSTYLDLPNNPILSSYTIGLDTPEQMAAKVEEAVEYGFEILKVKLGTTNDTARMRAILDVWDKPFSIDVNQGWNDPEKDLEYITEWKKSGLMFVEQPYPIHDVERSRRLASLSPVPIIADESVKRFTDLEHLDSCFHGINVKLMKSTGIAEALRMIQYARAKGLLVVTGCMAESRCAVGAMAHLSHLADWVDLDGPFLMRNDPFHGLDLESGKLKLSNDVGIGIRFNNPIDSWIAVEV